MRSDRQVTTGLGNHAASMPERPGLGLEECLVADELAIRAWRESDIAELRRFGAKNRSHLERWEWWPADYAEERSMLVDWVVGRSQGVIYSYGIWCDRELIGQCQLGDGEQGTWRVGCCVGEDNQGHGIATRSLRVLCRQAFGDRRCVAIDARIDMANTKSIGIVLRLGFRLSKIVSHTIDTPIQSGQFGHWTLSPEDLT